MNNSDATPYILADFDEDGLTGTTSIDPGVLVEMIEVTAGTIPAISRIARRGVPRKKHLIADGPEPNQGEGWYSQRGIRVRLVNESLEASINVILKHGSSVPEVATEIQSQVSAVVEKMFGLRMESLAVHVTGFEPEQLAV